MASDDAGGGETLRLHQANERTMLAWIRTGIALMAFGFAIARFAIFFRQVAAVSATPEHPRHALGSAWVGVALVGLGMLANFFATVRYRQIRLAIERGDVGGPDPRMVYVFGAIATLVGIVMAVVLLRAIAE